MAGRTYAWSLMGQRCVVYGAATVVGGDEVNTCAVHR